MSDLLCLILLILLISNNQMLKFGQIVRTIPDLPRNTRRIDRWNLSVLIKIERLQPKQANFSQIYDRFWRKKIRPKQGGKNATEAVSRVLLLRQSILAGRRRRCSVPPFGTAGPTITSRSVLHRVGFTWPPGLPDAGELLPRLSILTAFAAVSFCCTSPRVASACR